MEMCINILALRAPLNHLAPNRAREFPVLANHSASFGFARVVYKGREPHRPPEVHAQLGEFLFALLHAL